MTHVSDSKPLKMKTILFSLCLVAALLASCTEETVTVEVGAPPVTMKGDVVDVLHGVEIADPYRWLEDQESEETRAWIDEQNKFTDSVLEQLPGRDEMTELFTKLAKIDTITTPFETGGRYFYNKRLADQDLNVIYMREGLEGEETVVIDPHTMSEDHSVSVNMADVTDDGKFMVYAVRQGGKDEVEYRIRNIDTGEDLADVLPEARYYGVQLTNDKSTLYYTKFSMEGPRTYIHKIGDDFANDAKIFGDGYTMDKILFVGLSDDEKWLVATVLHGSSGPTEIHIKPTGSGGSWATVINDGSSRSFAGEAGGKLIIQTNLDAANGRIMTADPANPSVENWQELVPEKEDAVLNGFSAAGGKIIVSYLKDVQSVSEVYDIDGSFVREIAFDSIGSFGAGIGDWDSDEVFFQFSSFHIPPTIYRYDVSTGEKSVWATIDVPIDGETMELKQVWYESKDGTQIPMFVLHKKGLELNGTNPTLLYGYGGFTASMTPGFNGSRAAWVEMGGVYAVANLRGGGEFGDKWHIAGMMEKKQNVFDDFHAAAEWLIANKYTSSENLGIMGGSNGGLLVGAAMTQRPELFGAVVCTYPLLDMVRYHQFMVARFWVTEYGSSEDPEQFEYLHAYSPYHNVAEGTNYPATLFITGDGDTRVAPLHARKMAALVQELNGGENPIMLRYHTKAGHSGGMPLSERIKNSVDTYSFLQWQLGK